MNALGLLGYLGGTKNTQQPGEMGRREELHEHLCRYRQACHYIYTPSVDLVLSLSFSCFVCGVCGQWPYGPCMHGRGSQRM
jgi:hypothetical protein